jgi:hypothetical protein
MVFYSMLYPRLWSSPGDPISPLLFSLAFELLLRNILQDSSFSVFSLYLLDLPFVSHICSYPAMLLAYADNITYLLNQPAELDCLYHHLSIYSRALNVLFFNFHKTQALSLPVRSVDSSNIGCQTLNSRILQCLNCLYQ